MVIEEIVAPERERSPLRMLHDTQVSLERFRISISNRVSAISRGVDDVNRPVPEVYAHILEQAQQMEGTIDDAIAGELKNYPVFEEWLSHVKGIGPSLAGQMLALLLPPIENKGPSTWYKAAGLVAEARSFCDKEMVAIAGPGMIGVIYTCPEHTDNQTDIPGVPCGIPTEMRLPRARKGEGKITYHPWLRRCLYNVATSFVRNGGYYRGVYDRQKARLGELHRNDTAWPPIRVDRAARWAMVKLFLSHLWEAWAETIGVTPRAPYVVEKLGHNIIPRPMPSGKSKI